MLELRDVSKSYGKKEALVNFSAALSNGIYGILGPNGAGKSTLMNIIADVMDFDSGAVLYNGDHIGKLGEKYREHIGYLPQNVGHYQNFTSKMVLEYFAKLRAVPKKKINNRIEYVLSIVNLEDQIHSKIRTFSGGMKQRLGIAIALIADPQLLILDEPTVGLDPKERLKFRNVISELSKDKTIILSTHIVPDVDTIAQHIILMKSGRSIAMDTRERIVKLVDGKIWIAKVNDESLSELKNKYRVTNVERNIDGDLEIVIISESKPELDCLKKKTFLEDVYMYYFEETAAFLKGV